MNNEQKDETSYTPEWAEYIEPVINAISPRIIEYHRIKAPEIKRRQIHTFIILVIVVSAASVLAWHRIIDGSAAVAVIGAVLWYIFGNRGSNEYSILNRK